MPVVLLRDLNHGLWSHLGVQGETYYFSCQRSTPTNIKQDAVMSFSQVISSGPNKAQDTPELLSSFGVYLKCPYKDIRPFHGFYQGGVGGGVLSYCNQRLRLFRRALWLNIPGLFLVVTICALDGMVIFATYADCDLREQRKITRGDQVEIGRDLVYGTFSLRLLPTKPKFQIRTMSLCVITTGSNG